MSHPRTVESTDASASLSGNRPDPQTEAASAFATLVRTHFDILLGPGSDFIPVMLYEWRSLTPRQRAGIAQLQRDYEAAWAAGAGRTARRRPHPRATCTWRAC